jgi:hypothetical protein
MFPECSLNVSLNVKRRVPLKIEPKTFANERTLLQVS